MVEAYGKKGQLLEARMLFDRMPSRSLVSWTTMVAAYALNGHCLEALEVFGEMVMGDLWPDDVVFGGVLVACTHAGLVEQCRSYFVSMLLDYGIRASVEHYGCLIDVFARTGQLKSAEDLIRNMPFCEDQNLWNSLLGACKLQEDMKQGMRVLPELNPDDSSAYVLVSNLCKARA
ncbi:hypothetical protein SELMODRAFT_96437 [Selaginella moellendorffii]|uniref:Pentacotripeptide-repeat region of PRORP domain-containing protein n=2 Tax=Selaginella moellendorffii TaxID=88036 RepID=D8RL67_SELML|nr:hypothetical protein SELMODRAFT_96437 [Selaginella moellendorffii]